MPEYDLEYLERVAEEIETSEDKRVEDIEERYKTRLAYGLCDFLFRRFPDEAEKAFGSKEDCIRKLKVVGDVWFDKWDDNYLAGIASKVEGTLEWLRTRARR